MCKTRKAFYINSNDRNASSASSSDFQITLEHPLTLQDQTGLSVNSLEIPYTLKTMGPRNNKLYVQLGIYQATIYMTENATISED